MSIGEIQTCMGIGRHWSRLLELKMCYLYFVVYIIVSFIHVFSIFWTLDYQDYLPTSPDNWGLTIHVSVFEHYKRTIHRQTRSTCITTQARFKCVPTFCGSIIIHIFTLLFFLIEYSTFTDRLLSEHVAGYCTCANALMLGAIFFFCFRISAWFIVLNPIAATY